MKSSKTLIDYIFTFGTEFLVLLAGVLVYKFATSDLGESGFSEYAIGRRTISFLQPLLILGLGVGLPRYVAFAQSGSAKYTPGTYFVATALALLSVTVLFILSAFLFQQQYANWVFGTSEYSFLILPLTLCITGLILHAIVYAYFRGLIRMVSANILQLINLAVVPIIAFQLSNDTRSVLMWTGGGWVLFSLVFLILVVKDMKVVTSQLINAGKELLNYGVRRIPGDVMIMGLLSLPAYFAAHLYNDELKTAGDIAFSMSLLNMAGAAFAPICLILLPQATHIIANKDFSSLRRVFKRLTYITIGLSVAGLLFIIPFMDLFLTLYLGESREQLKMIASVTLLSSVGFSLYISLRSIIDAFYIRAINSRNIFISFLFFLICISVAWALDSELTFFLFSLVGSMTLLGILTYLQVYQIVKRDFK